MKITIPAQLSQIPHVIARVTATCPLVAPDHWKIELLIEEAIANIVEHGYQHNAGLIHIECNASKKVVAIEFRDSAWPFDPTSYQPEKTDDSDFPNHKGRGIGLIRHLSDAFEYKHDNLMNILTIKKMI